MKKVMSALCALAVLTGAGAAMAANTIGTIKYIDTRAMTFTLDNGTEYKTEKSAVLKKLKVGEQVMVTWDMKDGVKEASHVRAQ
jgi:Skp family chaperone for outer membrane proteins